MRFLGGLCAALGGFCCAQAEETPLSHTYVIGFHNGFLLSQEWAKHFFADSRSRIQPTPAYILALDFERRFGDGLHFVSTLTIPMREESVRIDGREGWLYYYPKALTIGAEYTVLGFSLGEKGYVSDLRLGLGMNTPLSSRLGQLLYPVFSFRCHIKVSQGGALVIGAGYAGNAAQGVLFVPFGYSYQL